MPEFDTEFDVVIVGGGPTGATLANLLGLKGVKVLVLERELAIYDLPRAVHFDDETMRVFQTVGIAHQLQDKIRVNPGMRFVDVNDKQILDWPRPPGIGKHGWHTSYRLHQPDLEELLRRALDKHPSCVFKAGKRVIDLQQHSDFVRVVYEDTLSGQTETINTKYVVGCDGANSSVRSFMSGDMEDLGFNERWLVVDILLNREMPELGDFTIQFCHPKQPMTYCRNPGHRRRWEMALPDSITVDEALNDERIWSLLSQWISNDDAEIERKAIYTFRSALANTWRTNRLLLAGDAAHLTPPFMGQGMCTGIRDASNLAWKLALCVKGCDNEQLLDTYQEERRPHARVYIATAIRLGAMINSIDQQKSDDVEANGTSTSSTMASPTPPLGDCQYFVPGTTNSLHKGRLFGQPMLADGKLLDDFCGYEPAILARHDFSELSAVRSYVKLLTGDDHPELAEELDELKTKAVLLRADRYIMGSADTEGEIAGLIDAAKFFELTE